jgi:fructokinase
MIRITSIGEILFDVYPEGKTVGGAPFNFIYHIINLTGEGNFVSRVGQDEEGKEIINFMRNNRITTNFIQIDEKHPTGESIATLDEMKIPSWEIKLETAYDYVELTEEIESLVSRKTDCLYFGTLAQRNFTTRKTICHFFNRSLKYFCDLNIRQNFYTEKMISECLVACNVLKLNVEELKLVNELLLNKNFDINDTPNRLLSEYQIDQLCVTNGDQGAVIYDGKRNNHFKLKVENVVDTVGAGDAYASILCLGYLKEWDIEKTNEIASWFAGEIVKITGALPADSALYDKYKKLINE